MSDITEIFALVGIDRAQRERDELRRQLDEARAAIAKLRAELAEARHKDRTPALEPAHQRAERPLPPPPSGRNCCAFTSEHAVRFPKDPRQVEESQKLDDLARRFADRSQDFNRN